MDINQKRKLLDKIVKLQRNIEDLECTRQKIASSEFSSASTSSGTGSKSYQRQQISQINDAILQLKKELKHCRRLIKGESGATSTTYFVYS